MNQPFDNAKRQGAHRVKPTYEELLTRLAQVEPQVLPFSERTQGEAAATPQTEERYRILDNMLEGCAVLGRDFTYLYVNGVNARHAHSTPQQMIGRNMLHLLPGVEKSPFFEAYRRCMDERTPQRVESKFTFGDGSSAWYEAKAEPVPEGIFVLSQDITERKQAEVDLQRALSEAEEGKRTLQALMDSVPEGITIADAKGVTIRMVSRYGKELLGAPHNLTASEVARQWPIYYPDGKSLMDPEDLPLTRAIRRGELVRDVELVQTNSQGERIPLLCNAAPIRDGQGDIIGGVVVWRDITERKRAEEALRESEARFRSVLEESRDVIYRLDLRTGRYEYISPSASAVLDFSPDELMAMEVEAGMGMVHPDDEPAMRAAVTHTEALGEGHAEYRQRTKSGEYRWLSNRMSLVKDGAGRPLYRNGNIRDITEAKRAERELRESETLLRSFFDSPGVLRGIVEVADDDILFVSVNTAAASLYGRSPEEVCGKRAADLEVPAEVAQLWLDRYRQSQTTNEPVTFEVRRPFAEGQAWFSATVGYLGTGRGGHPRFAYVMYDVTGIRRAEDAMRSANDQLREADRRKDEFLAVLSHELRNPLAPIRNSIYLLDLAPPGSEVARRARDMLKRQTDHLSRLVDDLLDMSRIAHGKIQLQLARIDARGVVRRACDDVRTVFEQRSVALRFSQATEPTWVDADAARLAQMVGNLVSNALKFTPPGGKVDVSVEALGNTCEVRVCDTGIGIEAADLDRIFEQFVQAGRTRHGAQTGLGIGLALVRELAEKHGGWVRAVSAGLGLGAEFVLSLPLAATPAGDTTKVEAEPAAPRLSVLIVEDNEDAAASLADLLALNGHEVKVVATGRAGIEAVTARAPDLLICDVGLPDVTGFEVIRALRAAKATVFSIALTGYAQQQDREQALAAGFDAHLAKPPALARLTELLTEAARRKG